MFSFKKKYTRNREIDPDEIFLDSSNLPDFDVHQFEGRIEKPITKNTVRFVWIFFLLVQALFIFRVGMLQVVQGDVFVARSENNRLQNTPIFSERGIIYDRNGVELAWNSPGEKEFFSRSYTAARGLAHVLGYVGYPAVDRRGFYYQDEFSGKEGIEKFYDSALNGKNGLKIIETNALLEVQSESVIKLPENGENLTLTVDSVLQSKLFELLASLSAERGFVGGAGVLMDVDNGEILALASFPEYDPSVLSEGKDIMAIGGYRIDERKPFLNRAVSGVYTPGSIVKPFVALGALSEGVITPDQKILSTGSIEIANPYFPDLKSVFVDWKAHGWVDMRDALAVSSNVYFYEVGGGFEKQKGIGILNIKKYAQLFGLGEPTGIDLSGEAKGVIPDPQWKSEMFDGEPWRVGDTYNTAIGQYGFQVTPLQMARAVAAIANGGVLVPPHVLQERAGDLVQIDGIDARDLDVVIDGMRRGVVSGTASGLNVSFVRVAAKTGTAEVGVSKKLVHSWIVGFFPYEKPKFSFAVVMEKGPSENVIGALFVMRQLLEWMAVERPEYLE